MPSDYFLQLPVVVCIVGVSDAHELHLRGFVSWLQPGFRWREAGVGARRAGTHCSLGSSHRASSLCTTSLTPVRTGRSPCFIFIGFSNLSTTWHEYFLSIWRPEGSSAFLVRPWDSRGISWRWLKRFQTRRLEEQYIGLEMEPSEKETHFVTKGLNSVLASLHSWCWGYVHEQVDSNTWTASDGHRHLWVEATTDRASWDSARVGVGGSALKGTLQKVEPTSSRKA